MASQSDARPLILALSPHERSVRGRRPAEGRHRPRRSRRVAAGRGRVGQAPQDQGGERAAALRVAPARRDARRGVEASPASSTRRSCGKCPATASSGSTIWRASTTARMRRARSRPRRSRCFCSARRCISTSAGRAATARRPPTRSKAALASVERKKREAVQVAEWVGRSRAHGCRTRSGRSSRCCSTARTRTRSSGRRSPPRATRRRPIRSRCSPRAARSRRRTSTTSTASSSRRSRAAPRSRTAGAAAALPGCRSRERACVLDRRPTTTEIDDAFSVRELRDGNVEIGIHIAAPALAIARGSPLDAVARARLSTVYMPGRKLTMLPDDARRRVHARGGRDAVRRCRSTSRRRPTATPRRAATRRRARPGRREPAAARDRRSVRERSAVAVRSAVDRRAACAVEARARLGEARGKTDIQRIDYSFYVDWDATGVAASRARVASSRGRAARRSTSSSPS